MEIVSLANRWKALNTHLEGLEFTNPKELQEGAGELLDFLTALCDEKIQLVARLKRLGAHKADEFLKEVQALAVKGAAYEERKLYMQLKEAPEIREVKAKLDTINEMGEAVARYERLLRLIHDSMKMEMKLSYEGHN